MNTPIATRARGPSRKPRGIALVEVLVAMVVLSLGLLGIGKLVMTALKANDSAYMRSQATVLAYAILDDMRANRQVAMTQGYDTSMSAYSGTSYSCVTAVCSPADLAQFDVAQWKQQLGAAPAVAVGVLPGGNGSIVTATTVTNQTTATITVQWNDALAQDVYTQTTGTLTPMTVTLETIL